MAWDDAPPTKAELSKADSWDEAPPTPEELRKAQMDKFNIMKPEEQGVRAYQARITKGALGTLPTVGMMAGGALGAPYAIPTGGLSVAAGGAGGAAAGYGLQSLGEKYLLGENKTNPEYQKGLADAAKFGAVGEMTGGILGKAGEAFANSGVNDISQLGNRPGAEQVKAAAAKLGVKPTQGMLTDDYTVRNLENSLSQSPSFPGAAVRAEQAPVYNAMQNAAQGATKEANNIGSVDAGREMKRGIFDYVNTRSAPIKQGYSDIAQETKGMPIAVDDRGRQTVARNMLGIEGAKFTGSDTKAMVEKFSQNLSEATDLNDIKTLKTMAIKASKSNTLSPEAQNAVSQIYQKLDRFQANATTRTLINKARAEAPQIDVTSPEFAPEGNEAFPYAKPAREAKEAEQASLEQGAKDIQTNKDLVTQAGETGKSNAKDLIGKSRSLGGQYAGMMGDLEKFGAGTGFSKPKIGKGPGGFLEDIKNVTPEEMSRVFDTGNEELMDHMEKTMPEVYETAKQQRLNDIVAKSSGPDGRLVPGRLAKTIDQMSPQMKSRLFGEEGASNMADVSTLQKSIPSKVGASDTPRGFDFKEMLNPMQNVRDAGRYGLLKGKKYAPNAGGLLKPGGQMATGLLREETK